MRKFAAVMLPAAVILGLAGCRSTVAENRERMAPQGRELVKQRIAAVRTPDEAERMEWKQITLLDAESLAPEEAARREQLLREQVPGLLTGLLWMSPFYGAEVHLYDATLEWHGEAIRFACQCRVRDAHYQFPSPTRPLASYPLGLNISGLVKSENAPGEILVIREGTWVGYTWHSAAFRQARIGPPRTPSTPPMEAQ